MPRIRYSDEVRQQALALVLESKQSAAQVARDLGCSVNTVHGWIKKHRREDNPPVEHHDKATFVPVHIIDNKLHPIEIVMPNGVTIKLADASPQYVAELLNVLASC